ncbi:MAG: patatin-like phospholipase family protein [Nocardioidaceae bacterium]|nr:patatin-like phospholipase family protein [Nocardioidaceae bacterium]
MTSGAGAASGGRATDLVLEGSGVKGLALAAVAVTLGRHGWRFPRVAGTSAGAIAAAVLVALDRAGEPIERAEELARDLPYAKLRDRSTVGRLLGPMGRVVDALSLAVDGGMYEGHRLHDWLRGVLGDLGVHTFADLREDDPGSALAPARAYRLVVLASDLSRRRLVRLPWDYPDYGLDPDEMAVADAVRASASIPFFFEPVTMRGTGGVSTLVDGGLLSTYPVSIFDRDDGVQARWPTLGVRLTAGLGGHRSPEPVRGPLSMALAVVEAALEAAQSQHVDDPATVARSVFVDTSGVPCTDFGITPDQQQQLWEAGRRAAERHVWAREETQ